MSYKSYTLELIFISFFHFLSEIPFKEKHKDSHNYKKDEEICSVSFSGPVIYSFVSEKHCDNQIGIFEKTVHFT